MNHVTGKHLQQGNSQQYPPSKRRRVDCLGYAWQQGPGLDSLPSDCLLKIFELLSSKELLIMERVSQGMKALTDRRWKQLAEKEDVDFDWSELANVRDPSRLNKERYRRGMALHSYIYARRILLEHQAAAIGFSDDEEYIWQRAGDIFNRFKETRKWSPCLWAHISNDLRKIARCEPSSQEDLALVKEDKKKAGDLLLKGLSDLADAQILYDLYREVDDVLMNKLNCAERSLKSAIEQGAICANFLAIRQTRSFSTSEKIDMVLRNLARITADKGDYRALDDLLYLLWGDEDPCLSLYEKNYPPVGILTAKDKIQKKLFQEAERIFDQAIEGYGDHVPGDAWLVGAEIKMKLNDLVMAEVYMDRSFTAFGENIPSHAWDIKAQIKEKCGDVREAIRSLNEIFLASEALYSSGEAIYHAGNRFANLDLGHFESFHEDLDRWEGIFSEDKESYESEPN